MNVTGTTVRDFDGTFPECQARVHICDYACCKFGPMGNWIATYPGEVEKARNLGLGFDHLVVTEQQQQQQQQQHVAAEGDALSLPVEASSSNTCSVTCIRPCVGGEFKSIDCLVGDSLVLTNHGLLRIEDIVAKQPSSYAAASSISSLGKISAFMSRGKKPVYKVTNGFGFEIEATASHLFEVLDTTTGNLIWKKVKDLSTSDFVPIRTKTLQSFHKLPLNFLDDPDSVLLRESSHNVHPINPQFLTEKLCWLLGLIISDGSNSPDGFTIANKDKGLLLRAKSVLKGVFATEFGISSYKKQGQLHHVLNAHSKVLGHWLQNMGCSVDGAKNKVVPWVVLSANTNCQAAFLCGFFDGDSSVSKKSFALYSASEKLLRTIHTMLVNFGVVTKFGAESGPKNTGSSIIDYTLYQAVGGALSYNAFVTLNNRYAHYKHQPYAFIKIPFSGIPATFLRDFFQQRKTEKRGKYYTDDRKIVPHGITSYFVNRSDFLSYHRLHNLPVYQELGSVSTNLVDKIEQYADNNVVFSPIVSVEPMGLKKVYDITVEGTNCFIANGWSVHNCAIYPLFPANDDASLFIVADHRKCPIPNSQLMGWAIKVRRLLEEIEAETPGTIANMAENGQGFKGYQAFPFRIWGSMAIPLRKFEVHTLFQHYVFESVTCKYAVGDTIKSLYTATSTPEDKGYSLKEIQVNPTSENS